MQIYLYANRKTKTSEISLCFHWFMFFLLLCFKSSILLLQTNSSCSYLPVLSSQSYSYIHDQSRHCCKNLYSTPEPCPLYKGSTPTMKMYSMVQVLCLLILFISNITVNDLYYGINILLQFLFIRKNAKISTCQ